jgi:hypothetical protein
MWANIVLYMNNKWNAAQKEGQEELKFNSETNLFYELYGTEKSAGTIRTTHNNHDVTEL